MINQLTGTLIRFRNGKWPLLHTQKISFLVSKEHRSLLHFLWWHDGDLSEKLIDHEMCVFFVAHPYHLVAIMCSKERPLMEISLERQPLRHCEIIFM